MIEQFQFLLSFIATRGPPLGTKLKIGLLKGKQTSCQLQENNLGLKLFLISPSRICLSAWHIWLNGRKWKSNNKVWPIQQSSAVFRLLQDGQRISFLFLTHNNFPPQMVQLLSSASRQDTRREISNTIFEFSFCMRLKKSVYIFVIVRKGGCQNQDPESIFIRVTDPYFQVRTRKKIGASRKNGIL